ncbi:hypothetical protein HK096_006578 [Nowakowskiella sp. JEL0078]|nr:hypothetical protein HK096_006578 [Nowakowskiella sp. JEL0078]
MPLVILPNPEPPSIDTHTFPSQTHSHTHLQTLDALPAAKTHKRSLSTKAQPLTIGGLALNSLAVSSLAALAASRLSPTSDPASPIRTPKSSLSTKQPSLSRRVPRDPSLPSPQSPKLSSDDALAAAAQASFAIKRLQATSISRISNDKLQDELCDRCGPQLFKLLLIDNVLCAAAVVAANQSKKIKARRRSVGEVKNVEDVKPTPSVGASRISFAPDGTIVARLRRSKTKKDAKDAQSSKRSSRHSIENGFPVSKLSGLVAGHESFRRFVKFGKAKLQLMKKQEYVVDAVPENLASGQSMESEDSIQILTSQMAGEMAEADLSDLQRGRRLVTPAIIESPLANEIDLKRASVGIAAMTVQIPNHIEPNLMISRSSKQSSSWGTYFCCAL